MFGISVLPVFLHIPRTAGTSLRVMLERQIPKERIMTIYGDGILHPDKVVRQWDEKIWGCAVVRGHMTFGVHNYINRPCSYFTILRNPLTRLVSLYKYIRRDRTHWANKKTKKMTFNQFMESGITLETNNGMVRQLCSSEGPLPQKPYGKTTTAFGECDRVLLTEALHNLSLFEVVGRMEYYEQTMKEICRTYDWKFIGVGKVNATAEAQDIEVDLDLFRQLNELDIELYQSGGMAWRTPDQQQLSQDPVDSSGRRLPVD